VGFVADLNRNDRSANVEWLESKVDPQGCALVIIDVQNDYCHDDGALSRFGRHVTVIRHMVPRLKEVLAKARQTQVPVVHVRMANNELTKSNAYLAKEIKTVILAGVTTDVCVESTARDAFMRDYHVLFLSDCTGVDDPAVQQAALERIDRYFGHVVSSEDVVQAWDHWRTRKG